VTRIADAGVARSVERLAGLAGDSLGGVVFFGSRLVGSSPDRNSAPDLFAIVDDYDAFYRRFAPVASRRSARTLALLNRWLPPNIVSFDGAKVFVIDRADFARDTGPRSRDHFCRGRLAQRAEIVWAASDEARVEIGAGIESARRTTLDWALLECPPVFDVPTFCERMLVRSYAAEIRPETPGRVREVLAAQREFWVETYGPILAASPDLAAAEGGFRLVRSTSRRRRLRWNLYFRRSRARATLRWAKYVLTFEGWLDYIVKKVERRTGHTIELTERERRWPLLFLWPKAWRVLRNPGSPK